MQDLLKLDRVAGKKGSQFKLTWSNEQIESFRKVKEAAAGSLVLFQVDPDKPFAMRCDASDFVIGSVLEQRHPNDKAIGRIQPVEEKLVPVSFFLA